MREFTDSDYRIYEKRFSLAYSSVCLVVSCSNLNSEQISQALDLQPTSACNAGDDVVGSSTGDKYSSTIWSLSSVDFVREVDLNSHLKWMMNKLSAKRTVFKQLRKLKSKMRLECLTHTFVRTSVLDTNPELLMQLSQSGISLRVASIFHADERESKMHDKNEI